MELSAELKKKFLEDSWNIFVEITEGALGGILEQNRWSNFKSNFLTNPRRNSCRNFGTNS